MPFIGAGMSRNKFADWPGFAANLEKVSGVQPGSDQRIEPRAQRAATAIRNSHTEDEFWKIISTALRGEDYERSEIPPQTEALAEIYWPLTLSTNYDHLLYCACQKAFDDRLPPMVLGRSADDCKQLYGLITKPVRPRNHLASSGLSRRGMLWIPHEPESRAAGRVEE